MGGTGSLTALPFPHQIGQAIEEVNSNNQELLRKYRRELQLRKKCHNELVRLKGDCRVGWGVPSRRTPDLPWGCSCPSLWPQFQSLELCPVILRHCCDPLFVNKGMEAQKCHRKFAQNSMCVNERSTLGLSNSEAFPSAHGSLPGVGGAGH